MKRIMKTINNPAPAERIPIERDPKRDAWFDERFDEMKDDRGDNGD